MVQRITEYSIRPDLRAQDRLEDPGVLPEEAQEAMPSEIFRAVEEEEVAVFLEDSVVWEDTAVAAAVVEPDLVEINPAREDWAASVEVREADLAVRPVVAAEPEPD